MTENQNHQNDIEIRSASFLLIALIYLKIEQKSDFSVGLPCIYCCISDFSKKIENPSANL
jgi:hypothetical protein